MVCYSHPERAASATCTVCEKTFCEECIPQGQDICINCLLKEIEYCKSVKKSRITTLIIGVALGAIMIIVSMFVYGFEEFYDLIDFLEFALGGLWCGLMLANIHVGWKSLSKFASKFFAIFSIPGWLLYYMLKFFVALFIGWIAAPISAIKHHVTLKKLKELAKNIYKLDLE